MVPGQGCRHPLNDGAHGEKQPRFSQPRACVPLHQPSVELRLSRNGIHFSDHGGSRCSDPLTDPSLTVILSAIPSPSLLPRRSDVRLGPLDSSAQYIRTLRSRCLRQPVQTKVWELARRQRNVQRRRRQKRRGEPPLQRERT